MQKRAIRVLDSELVTSSKGPSGEDSGTVCFGVFELDLRTGQLRRNGTRVKLQEQPFQVLALLLAKPGSVVTREDLRERLWPADTFVDFDHSLNAAIRRLRDALGDSAENPIFVETVARRGYRFLAPVARKSATEDDGAVPTAEPVAPSSASRLRKWIGAGFAAVILVLLGLKLGMMLDRAHVPPQVHRSQLTANSEDDRIWAAAISRDGKYLAFSDERGFYLRQIDTGETHSVVLPENLKAASISWFPDNVHMVVALMSPGTQSSLWELSALGGSPRKLLEDGNRPAVSPNGQEIAFIVASKLPQQLCLMESDGSRSRKLIGDDGDLFGTVAWSPDGTRLAYTHAKLDYVGGNEAIEILQVHGQSGTGAPVQLSRWTFSGLEAPLAWSDRHLIYTLMEQPPNPPDTNLWSVEVDGRGRRTGDPVRLSSDTGDVFSISITADGKRITYLKGVPHPDVYVAEVKGPGVINEPQRLTFEQHKDIPYDWTLDNKDIIFASDRTGALSIYKQAIDQLVPDLLVRSAHQLIESRLSPDGTQLIYVEHPNWGENDSATALMRAPLAGGAPQRILEAKWITNQQCARAPAATCLYSILKDQALTFFTFDPFKGKGKQVLRIEQAAPKDYNWSLSPDGSMLAIASARTDEQPRIRLVPLNGTPENRAPEKWLTIHGWPGLAALDWAADSKSLWAPSTGDEQNTLLNIDLQGQVRAVWQPKKKIVGWAIPSRDGRFLALHVGSTSANAWMLERH